MKNNKSAKARKPRRTAKEKVQKNLQTRVDGMKDIVQGIAKEMKAVPHAVNAVTNLADLPGNIVSLRLGSALRNVGGIVTDTAKATKEFVPGAFQLGKGIIKTAFNHEEWYGGNTAHSSGPSLGLGTKGSTLILGGLISELDPGMLSFDLVSQNLRTEIAEFDKSLGFQSNLTPQMIREAITANIRLASIMETVKRLDNSWYLKLFGSNLTFGDRFNNTQNPSINLSGVNARIFSYTPKSNKAWETDVIANSLNIYISHNMKEFIAYHFGNFFTNSVRSSYNGLLEFTLPLANNSFTTTLTNSISTWNAKMAVNSMIPMFLEYIGFSKLYDREYFRRNMTPIYSIISDEELLQAFGNRSNLSISSNKIVLPVNGVDIDPFSPSHIVNITIGEFGKSVKFNIMSASMIGSYQVVGKGTAIDWNPPYTDTLQNYGSIDFGARIIDNIDGVNPNTNLPANSQNIVNALIKSITPWELLGVVNLNPYLTLLEYEDGSYNLTQIYQYNLPTGFDGYIENDYDLLVDVVSHNLMMPSAYNIPGQTGSYRKVALK